GISTGPRESRSVRVAPAASTRVESSVAEVMYQPFTVVCRAKKQPASSQISRPLVTPGPIIGMGWTDYGARGAPEAAGRDRSFTHDPRGEGRVDRGEILMLPTGCAVLVDEQRPHALGEVRTVHEGACDAQVPVDHAGHIGRMDGAAQRRERHRHRQR